MLRQRSPAPAPGLAELKLSPDFAQAVTPIAAALLPSELSAREIQQVVEDFIRWLKEQDPNAGVALNSFGFENPKPGTKLPFVDGSKYAQQLEALKAKAAPRSIGELDTSSLRDLIRSQLKAKKPERLPARPQGNDLFIDVLAFFYGSPVAFDVFYKKRIGLTMCRGFDGVSEPPVAL